MSGNVDTHELNPDGVADDVVIDEIDPNAPIDDVDDGGEPAPIDDVDDDGRDYDAEAKARGWHPDGGDLDAKGFVEQGEVMALARRQGWRPDGPKSAQEFVDDGERIANRNKERLEVQAREHEERYKRLERMSQMALDRQREADRAAYDNQIRSAVEVGDVDSFDRLNTAKDEALKAYEVPEAETPAPAQNVPAPEFTEWAGRNKWINDGKHTAESQYATAYFQGLLDKYPNANQADLLPHLDANVASVFPYLVEVKPRQEPRRITDNGGARRGSSRGRAKGAADLPAEARSAGTDYVERGLFKDLNAYAADYWAADQEG